MPKPLVHPLEPEPEPSDAESAFARFRGARHLPSLDGLRCLAILPVIWHHATPRPLPGLLGKGAVGVDLFFSLSGFLITTLLLRERRAHGSPRLGAFYARRALRIFPLYYAVLALYCVHAALLPEAAARAHFVASLPYHATYTANWFVDYAVQHPVPFAFSWSLCVEEQFYLVWPLLLALVARRSSAAALMAATIALDFFAERGALGSWLPAGSLGLRVVTSFATPIGLGSLLALALDERRSFTALRALLGGRAAAPALLGLALLLLAQAVTPYFWLSLCLTGLVGAVVIRGDHGLAWLLDRRALAFVGTLSYAAYLLHVSALGLVRRAFPAEREHALFVLALGLPLTLALAAAAHYGLERPCLRLRERLREGLPQNEANDQPQPRLTSATSGQPPTG